MQGLVVPALGVRVIELAILLEKVQDPTMLVVDDVAIRRASMVVLVAAIAMTRTVADWRLHIDTNLAPLPHPSWRNTGWLNVNPWFEAELLPVLRTRVLQWIS